MFQEVANLALGAAEAGGKNVFQNSWIGSPSFSGPVYVLVNNPLFLIDACFVTS